MTKLRAFWLTFKEWGFNAEKGLALWLLIFSSLPLLALFIEPDKVPYAEALQQGGMGIALAVWLLWVNPVKRSLKRQLAIARRRGLEDGKEAVRRVRAQNAAAEKTR